MCIYKAFVLYIILLLMLTSFKKWITRVALFEKLEWLDWCYSL